MTVTSLFDYVEAAGSAANPDWMALAREAVQALAERGQPFTTDDVWDMLAGHGCETHEPRALGAVVRGARRDGLIVPVGYQPSTRSECHGRPVRVWHGTPAAAHPSSARP